MGPECGNLLPINAVRNAHTIKIIVELALIIALFSGGLKLRSRLSSPNWRIVARLAFCSMAFTAVMFGALTHSLVQIGWGGAFALGATLAATDPVLAAQVQVADPFDPNRLRFGLTGEAGLNDGAAFPFFQLGIGLMGLGAEKFTFTRWILLDLLWGTLGGIGIGLVLGWLVGKAAIYLRRERREALGLGFLLAPALTLVAYGIGELSNTYGFLTVLCTGVALRTLELHEHGPDVPEEEQEISIAPSRRRELATGRKTALTYLTQELMQFSERLEQLGEAVVVTLTGAILPIKAFTQGSTMILLALLFLVVRPAATTIGLIGSPLTRRERLLIAWFGIRGAGSIYYLTLGLTKGLPARVANPLLEVTTAAVAISIIVHGLTVTPLMSFYTRSLEKDSANTS